MTIVFCNGKGGAGKTTLSILLGCALADAGRRVGLIDRDSQKTATRWLQETESGVELAVAGETYDATIIDTPPRLESDAVHQSLREADRVVLVSSPSPADLWTSQETSKVIQNHYRGKKAALLFNQVQRNTTLAREMPRLGERIGLAPLKCQVGRRQSYQHAMLLGWKALDAPAREEILQVSLEIITF
ncbi:ParA family protein [Synoicihabitans lomoniglobus]|uniref:ParA family protein n=1 Tax=Synoicihabitans lomoniglobus TaxID=2909285 RepID=A0AAE9ZZJ0_9BACT|nr:ParA family protein [Opitutaceae bacterium LMO-M01]WED65723.1 ParA family protein [Opitutaceae bacterium LMO-M01]